MHTITESREDVRDAARTVMSEIPGFQLDMIQVQTDPKPNEGDELRQGAWSVIVIGHAWGPGLHSTRVTWTETIGRHTATRIPILRTMRRRRLVDTVRRAFRSHITLQYARSKRALTLGIYAPLELPSAAVAASTPDSIRIDHLLVDRIALVRLVDAISTSQGTPGALRAPLDRQIAFDAASAYERDLQAPTIHAGESVRDDGRIVRGVNVIRSLPVMLSEIRTDQGDESLLQAYFAFGGGDAPIATFNGSHLVLLSPLPETALAACVGRTVGELIGTGTAIDLRIILSAQMIGSTTVIATDVDPIRVSDLPAGMVTHADIAAMPAVRLL